MLPIVGQIFTAVRQRKRSGWAHVGCCNAGQCCAGGFTTWVWRIETCRGALRMLCTRMWQHATDTRLENILLTDAEGMEGKETEG